MSLSIRAARPDDFDAVATLLQVSYAALLAESYSASVLSLALPHLAKANKDLLTCGTWYVAEEAGTLVGCGGWTSADPLSGKKQVGLAHLRHFACDPKHARTGIGRALAKHCFACAGAAGIEQYECCSTLNAESFYLALGFATISKTSVPMGPDVSFPGVLMRRGR